MFSAGGTAATVPVRAAYFMSQPFLAGAIFPEQQHVPLNRADAKKERGPTTIAFAGGVSVGFYASMGAEQRQGVPVRWLRLYSREESSWRVEYRGY